MNLLVIRHGQSEADILNVNEGRADFSLTALGETQAKLMAEWVSQKYSINKIFASPLKRASQTAKILSERMGIDIVYDDDLMEFQNGLIAGMPFDEAQKKYPKPEIRYPHTLVYKMESDIQFRMRAETALSKIINENPVDTFNVIVSHGGMINMLFRSFLELPTNANISISSGDTGIHHWKIDGINRRIVYINGQTHLSSIE